MILCWRRHGKAGGCRIPLKTIRWMRFEIERTHRNGWTICDEDVLTYTSREVLFHITGFYQWFISSSLSRLWMTDKWSVKWLYIAVRKQSFLTHVQARYENKTLRRLMKASFQRIRNILFSQCTLKTAYWKSDTKFKPRGLKQISRHWSDPTEHRRTHGRVRCRTDRTHALCRRSGRRRRRSEERRVGKECRSRWSPYH